MKKIITTVFFLANIVLGYAQNESSSISLNFENASRIEVLHQIEKLADFSFLYAEEWFTKETISGNFSDVPISQLLDKIFENTTFNYFILPDTRIVITQNRVIYGSLPENYFNNKEQLSEELIPPKEQTISPVFTTEKSSSENSIITTIRIGKENLNDARANYSLSGYVKNPKSDKGWPHVSIKLKNSSVGVVTDEKGFYKIRLKKGYNRLTLSSLGLERIEMNVVIYNDGTYNFMVSEDIELLEEIIVSSSQTANVQKSEIGTNEVDSEESKNIPLVMGERNILKVATSLPGITTAGEGSAGFNVRGGKTDQNLILLDHAVLYNPSHFFGIFQALNPFTTKSIKIYKGSVPAQFGGRLSSVFDIKTKDASITKFKGEASIGPVTNNIALEIPLIDEKAGIMIGGRSTYSDWILKALDEESLKNSKASFYDLIAKFNAKIDSTNKIQATAYYSKDNFSITSDSIFGYNNVLFSLNWNKIFNDKNIANLSLTNSQYKFMINYDGTSNENFDFDYGINEIGAILNMSYIHSNRHKFNYGLSVKKYSVSPGTIVPLGQNSDVSPISLDKEHGFESAIFVADDFEINDKLLVNLGLRYSRFQAIGSATQKVYDQDQPRNEASVINTLQFGDNEKIRAYGGLETRISGRYLLDKDMSIKIGYNSMYQYIHTLSNTTTLSPIDSWKLSDYNVEPQQSQQLALGIFKNINANDYEISLEGYYKKSKNVPDFKTGANLLLNENVETEILQGDGKSYGVEFLVRKNIGKLSGWVGYTYSRSFIKLDSQFEEERINGGNFFPANYDKPHNLNIVSNFKVTRRFSFSANFEYQTGRPVTYPIGNFDYQGDTFVIYSDRNKFRIPDYYRLDLSFNVEGNHKLKKLGHSFWNISIYNVLGRNNPYSVFFVTEQGDVKAYKSSIFSIPIPSISYNIKF